MAIVGLFATSLAFSDFDLEGAEGALNGFVAVFDSDLELEWAAAFEGFDSVVRLAVEMGDQGEVYVAGGFDGNVVFPGGSRSSQTREDLFVMRLGASDGTEMQFRHLATTGTIPVMRSNVGPMALEQDESGALYLCAPQYSGVITQTMTTADDLKGEALLVKMDAEGNEDWAKTIGGLGPQIPTAMTLDAEGRPVLTGIFGGSYQVDDYSTPSSAPEHVDLFVSRLSPEGAHDHSVTFTGAPDPPTDGATDASALTSLTVAENGDLVAVGWLFDELDLGGTVLRNNTSTQNYDVLLLRLGSAFETQRARRFGFDGPDLGIWGAEHPSGLTMLTGFFGGPLRVGEHEFQPQGESDMFLVHDDL